MKTDMTLTQLAQRIQSDRSAARDFVAPTQRLTFLPDGSLEVPTNGSSEAFRLTEHAHRQISDRLQIPAKLYDRFLQDHPDLLAHNVNTLFQREPELRMVRTMGPAARAFLSNRYRRFDHWQVAESVLPVLAERGGDVRIESSAVTNQRLYIKAVFPRVQGEVRVGDVVQAGVVISNSEIGGGSTKVEPMTFRLVCANGMVIGDLAAARHHVGRAAGGVGRAAGGDAEESQEIFADDTRRADDHAFTLKLRDTLRAAMDEAVFGKVLNDMRKAAGEPLTAQPMEAVRVLTQAAGLGEAEQDSVLSHLLSGGDLSRWGVANAITRAAADVESYDRATDLERLGGQLLTDSSMWSLVTAN